MEASGFSEVFKSLWFWSGFGSWMLAQSIKLIIDFVKTKKVNIKYFVSTGGMPSAHSATVSGLATSIGLTEGFGSPIFVLSLTFAIITMFDASTVRRAAGIQARILNEMIDELFKKHKFSEKKLVELLGHTRLEVFCGMLTGILLALLIYSLNING